MELDDKCMGADIGLSSDDYLLADKIIHSATSLSQAGRAHTAYGADIQTLLETVSR